MVSRKDFIIAKSIFDRYDTDGDGSISADEFVRALKQHAPLVEGADLFMKLDRNMTGVIGLVQWLHIYFPHVHMSECRRVVSKYLPKPRTPTPPSVKTLEDCPGAKEEIKAIFQHWDKQGNGNISLEDLQSPLVRCGISGTTALLWLNDGWEGSPVGSPTVGSLKGTLSNGGQIDEAAIAKVLASVYIEGAEPVNSSKKKVKRQSQILRDLELSAELISQVATHS